MSEKLDAFKYTSEQIHKSFDRRNVHVLDEVIAYAEQLESDLSASQARESELRERLKAAEIESKMLEVRVKLCTSCGFRPSCPTRNDDGGLCDDYVAQPKEPKQ